MADVDHEFKFINAVAIKNMTDLRRKHDDQLVDRIRDGILGLEQTRLEDTTSVVRNELLNQLAPMKRDMQMFKAIWEELVETNNQVKFLKARLDQLIYISFWVLGIGLANIVSVIGFFLWLHHAY